MMKKINWISLILTVSVLLSCSNEDLGEWVPIHNEVEMRSSTVDAAFEQAQALLDAMERPEQMVEHVLTESDQVERIVRNVYGLWCLITTKTGLDQRDYPICEDGVQERNLEWNFSYLAGPAAELVCIREEIYPEDLFEYTDFFDGDVRIQGRLLAEDFQQEECSSRFSELKCLHSTLTAFFAVPEDFSTWRDRECLWGTFRERDS